jgi:serine/threonine protein phosphatase PrpC
MSAFDDMVDVARTNINYLEANSHEEMNPRRRNTMEDVHRIVPFLKGAPDFSYFGVYDGHGGRQIADFLEETLESNIAIELQQGDDASVLERIQRAYLITDMQSRRLNIVTSGATAVSAVLHTTVDPIDASVRTSRNLYVANIGDSRAVLVCELSHSLDGLPTPVPVGSGASTGSEDGKQLYAYRLTYDHRAEDMREQSRVEAAGGFITRGRVLGILAVSRSFGDHGMKDFVIADPHLTEVDLLKVGRAPMLIMACDGVWDVFSDQEAAEMLVMKYAQNGNKPFDASGMLVQAAMDRGSADNITAIVVFL